MAKNLPAGYIRDSGSIPGSGRSLEKEMAAHSSILAWEIPWTEEPGWGRGGGRGGTVVHGLIKSWTQLCD